MLTDACGRGALAARGRPVSRSAPPSRRRLPANSRHDCAGHAEHGAGHGARRRYDLGSGDGRIPIAAARMFGARGVGIEIEPNLVRRANDNLSRAGVGDRVVFLNQDLFEADISQATVVTLFLLPGVNQKLMPKLQRELRPGTRVVSLNFTMGEAWPADLAQEADGFTIYMWTIK